jgi:hypothetical protein
MLKHYLGDGVYVEANLRGLVLTTEDGVRTTNTIVLEPSVWTTLRQIGDVLLARAVQAEGFPAFLPCGCAVGACDCETREA